MAIKHSVLFNGKQSRMKLNSVKKLLKDTDKLYSGSVQFSASTFVFNFVNSDAILYIVDEIKKRNEESQIEIQTYVVATEEIQQESSKRYQL